jgi:hypothetical protein
MGLASIIRVTSAAISTFVGILFILLYHRRSPPVGFSQRYRTFPSGEYRHHNDLGALSRLGSVRAMNQLVLLCAIGHSVDGRWGTSGSAGRLQRRRGLRLLEN